MELKEFLVWVSTVGAAVITYAVMEEIAWFETLSPRDKRRMACVISAGLAILGYLAQIGMGYQPVPTDWRNWIEVIFAVGTGAFGLATLIHGEAQLSG